MKAYRNPVPTVDAIIQCSRSVLLVKRKKDPYKGLLALPGGFVNEGETVEDAVIREVCEETSLEIHPIEILGVYSDPNRDPRGHILSVVFIGIIVDGIPTANDDAQEVQWVDIDKLDSYRIAFDHRLILYDYIVWKNNGGTFWTSKKR